MKVYFDNSATTKPLESVVEVVANAMMDDYANPSSLHREGLRCQKKLLHSREVLASTINATKEEIFFTSGGSESNNMIIKGIVKPGNHIITTKFEHPSVINTYRELENQGVGVTYLDVDSNGIIDIHQLEEAITKNTALVSIMHINNEIGAIQHLETIGKIIKEKSKRAKFHVDGVQSYGKIKVDVKKCNIDFFSTSGHKIHGPKGIGFCYVRKGLTFNPLITGGGQESGLRSGTENLPAVLGFVKAAEVANLNLDENYKKAWELKEYFINSLSSIENIRINAPLDKRNSPYILNVSFIGVRSEVLLHLLEEKDIYVSTGSACSSKVFSTKGSHVLNAIGLKDKEIQGAIRFSFCPLNNKEEVDYTVKELETALKFLRRVKI